MTSNKPQLLRSLSKHLVGLQCFDTSHRARAGNGGKAITHIFSCIFIEIRGTHYLLTSGHILNDINEAMAQGSNFQQWRIEDFYNDKATSQLSLPFAFENARQIWKYDNRNESDIVSESICPDDFGVIEIDRINSKNLLNNGCIPLTECDWKDRDWPKEFDAFYLVGIPKETVERNGGTIRRGVFALPVEQIPHPDADGIDARGRFCGRIVNGGKHGENRDINGMSGGPIIGFRTIADKVYYWPYAIQSHCLKNSQIIFACRIQPAIQQLATQICGE